MGGEAGLDQSPTPPELKVDASNGFWARIRAHKVIQWGVAYLGAALALAHGAELVGHALNWPEFVSRIFVLALIVGFPIALTLAWYHGHRGLSRISAGELAIVSLLMLIGGIFFTVSLRSATGHGATVPEPSNVLDQATAVRNGGPANSPSGSYSGQERLPNSVAVLPCVNQSPNAADAYFAGGIHEAIFLQLAKLRNLNPTPLRAVMRYAESGLSVSQIGDELHAQWIVDCRVRYAEKRVRIVAQLIDAASTEARWTESYESEFDDIFATQAEIAMDIANAVGVKFSSAEQAELERPFTRSPEAYRLWLEAQALFALQTPDSIRQGLLLRDKALELDPVFPRARASKITEQVSALVYTVAPDRRVGDQVSRAEPEPQVREAVARAIAADPSSGPAHINLATLDLYTWRWTNALAEFRRADKSPERLFPVQYGFLTMYVGSAPEGIRLAERELQRDARSFNAYQLLGIMHGYMHDFDAAVTDLHKAQELGPTGFLVSNWLAYMEIARRNDAEALKHLQFSEALLGGQVNVGIWSEFAYAYHRLGRRADAERFYRDLVAASADRPLGAGNWAIMSLAMGENDKALEWLAKAAEKVRNHDIDEGFYALMNLKMNFTNDPLLDEPRFADAFRKLRGD